MTNEGELRQWAKENRMDEFLMLLSISAVSIIAGSIAFVGTNSVEIGAAITVILGIPGYSALKCLNGGRDE